MGWGGERRQEISCWGEKTVFLFLFFCGSDACGILVLWPWDQTQTCNGSTESWLLDFPCFSSFCLLFSFLFPSVFLFDCEKHEGLTKWGLESLQSWDSRGSAKCYYRLHIEISFYILWEMKGKRRIPINSFCGFRLHFPNIALGVTH